MAAADKRAEDRLAEMSPRATDLSSAQLRTRWSEVIKERSVFSARTTEKAYVEQIKARLLRAISRGSTPQVLEDELRDELTALGYTPQTGFPSDAAKRRRIPPATPGSIRDLSSSRRIQLIIDTNVKQAESMAQIASSDDPVFLMANPAWHLTRTGARRKPRGDWRARWKAAGDACGWVGAVKSAMTALKTSPIWEMLASGAGGYRDTVGSPFPPFAFGSGLAWVNVGRRAWRELCAREGTPDGLAEIAKVAKQIKAGQEARGGVGAFGAQAVGAEAGTLAHVVEGNKGETEWKAAHGEYFA